MFKGMAHWLSQTLVSTSLTLTPAKNKSMKLGSLSKSKKLQHYQSVLDPRISDKKFTLQLALS